MLTGRSAFEGDTLPDTFARILGHEPEWTALPPDTPASIRTLLERCLRKDQRRRLHDIADALIEVDDAGGAASTGSAPARPAAHGWSRSGVTWFVAAAAGAAAIVMAVLYVRTVPPVAAVIQFTIPPPENWHFTGESTSWFEVSPDGQHVVTAAISRGISMLWIRPVSSPEWRQLPGTDDARAPFWSPDSQSVAFFTTSQLKTVRINGGSPVSICTIALGQGSSGAWSRGNMLVFGGRDSVRKVPAAGGVPTAVTTLQKGEIAHRWPSFLPDGDRFLYLAQTESTNELRIASLASAETFSLGQFESNAVYAAGYLVFIRGGRLVAQAFDPDSRQLTGDSLVLAEQAGVIPSILRGQFSVSAEGVLAYSRTGIAPAQLTWMDRAGKPLGTVGEPSLYGNLGLSRDGRRLAVTQTTRSPGSPWNVDIWIMDLERESAMERVTFDPAAEGDPAWSPDGSQIAFNSTRIGGRWCLFRRPASRTGEDELLVKSEGATTTPDWSPDGRALIYTDFNPTTKQDLWTVSLSGDRQPSDFLNTPYVERWPVFSPGGRWIAYQSEESGTSQVYVRPFPRKEEQHQVSRDGGRAARWRSDGKELYFLAPDGTLMAAAMETATAFHPSVPRPLFQTGIVSVINPRPYVAAPNGQRFLVPVVMPPGYVPINVIVNWPVLLAK